MGDMLFLAHCVPFATGNGDESRGFHVLKHLAARKRIHLIAFADDPGDLKRKQALTSLTASRSIIWRPKPGLGTLLRAFVTGRPAHLAALDDALMRQTVKQALGQRAIDTVYLLSSGMAQYLPQRAQHRVMIDLIEPASTRSQAVARTGAGPARLWAAREARLLRRHERMVIRRADASLVASDGDALSLRDDADGRVRVLENGIDTDHYDPKAAYRQLEPTGMLIVFAGQAGGERDIAAASRFADTVLPHIRARYPDARLAILGRTLSKAATALARRHDGVMVVGEVVDRRPWLAAASVVVGPEIVAGSLRNGLLEAMAMGRPVVASRVTSDQIDHAGTIRTADSVGEFADEVLWALAHPAEAAELGEAARKRVTWRYHWESCLGALDPLLRWQPRDAAASDAGNAAHG